MTQRASYTCAQRILVAALIALSFCAERAAAQPGGGMGNVPTSPGTMFGKKKDNRVATGPSLSATDESVADIRIVGNSTIPTSKIMNELQTRIGRPFDPALVQKDIRKLASRGWFVDVQPKYEQAPNGRIVIFKVVERPIVRYVEYLGNEGVRTKKLAKETDLKVGGPVDPYAVQEAKRKIIDLYHRNGYNNAQVTILEGDKPTDHGIVFVINEGQAQKIWKVAFVGNEFLTERRLRTKIDSKPPLLKIFKGYVDRDQIDADTNKLIAFYRSFGFFDAKIGRELDYDEKNKWLTLRFVIHEGQRYEVENVAFIGNRIFSTDSLTSGVELKPDPDQGVGVAALYHKVKPLPPGPRAFEQDRMNDDVAWLKELYGSQGYIFADVRAEPIFLEEPGKLKLLYHIEEGKRWRIGNIYVHINGENPHTKITTALNRLSMRSGEIADIREVRASERRLQASGLFLTDPIHGVSPKITYHIPEVDGTERANKSGGFRGQSPDSTRGTGGMSLAPAPGLPVVVQDGPPLIAPPGASPGTAQLTRTYKIATAEPAREGEESLDVHLYFEDEATAAAFIDESGHLVPRDESPVAEQPPTTTPATTSIYSQPAVPATTGPVVHEVHRYPYDEPAPTAQQTTSGQWASAQPATAQRAPAQAAAAQPVPSTYQRLVVRTQSPYQAVTPTTSTNPYSTLPVAGAAQPATKYATQAYGGQAVGATGPESVAPGSNQYAVQQAAITEPYIPPQSQPTPAFGPPPMAAEQLPVPPGYAQPQPQQGYAPAPQGAPVPQGAPGPQPGYGPPGYYRAPLSPDPSITPVPPIPTNPQLLPSTPMDLLTPAYDPAADMNVELAENQTGRIMLGVAVNSDAGLVGQILLDEQNFDWTRFPTSWDEVWSGKAWRGNGEHFRLEAAPGTEVQRYLASWVNPYFLDTPVSLNLSGSYFSRRYQDWDEQRAGGRVGLGYQWVENDVSMMLSYRGENVKISNPSNPALPALAEVLGDNILHGFKYTVANDTRDSAFLATEGHFLQMELEEVIGTFEYPRATFDARQYFLMNERPDHSGRHVVTLSTRLGFTGNDTPIYENFFAGGFSTMRGFEFRGASPVEQGVQVGGRFEWLNTVEYLFPLTADDMIHGVAFCDFGTVEQDIAITGDNFRVAPGVGLRITVPAMGPAPIALDFAFPVLSAPTDEKQVFSFNIGLQR